MFYKSNCSECDFFTLAKNIDVCVCVWGVCVRETVDDSKSRMTDAYELIAWKIVSSNAHEKSHVIREIKSKPFIMSFYSFRFPSIFILLFVCYCCFRSVVSALEPWNYEGAKKTEITYWCDAQKFRPTMNCRKTHLRRHQHCRRRFEICEGQPKQSVCGICVLVKAFCCARRDDDEKK